MDSKDLKDKYFRANIGNFDSSFEFMGLTYDKVEDLRYATNPHQRGAIYVPKGRLGCLGAYKTIKTGKGGLSQTNVEDINYAVKVIKYFANNTAVVMKHLNPSGVSTAISGESLREVYINAREADPQAAFGGVVVFNKEVDSDTAKEIMTSIIEVVAAPSYTKEAINIFNDFAYFKRNKHIRIIELSNMESIPRFIGDDNNIKEVKVLQDGAIILSDPYLTRIRTTDDFILAYNSHKAKGDIRCAKVPTDREFNDLLTSWYINLSVRSNGVVIVKNGTSMAIGTGQQDRVGAVQQAIDKANTKYKGNNSLEGAVISSDGFFPFKDSIDLIAKAGITAIVQPGGSVSDYNVIKACNEFNISMVFSNERCFSHH